MRGKAESPHSENESGACGRTEAGKTSILTGRKRPQNAVFCGQFLFQRWNSCGQKFSTKIQAPQKLQKHRKRPEIFRFPVVSGADYWTRTSDLMRVNGSQKIFLTICSYFQPFSIVIFRSLQLSCLAFSICSTSVYGMSCGQRNM